LFIAYPIGGKRKRAGYLLAGPVETVLLLAMQIALVVYNPAQIGGVDTNQPVFDKVARRNSGLCRLLVVCVIEPETMKSHGFATAGLGGGPSNYILVPLLSHVLS
jgi:hypothetical protein